jgi:diphthine synthase
VLLFLVLFLVGVGLTPKYVTEKAKDVLKSSDIIFVDSYTMPNVKTFLDYVKTFLDYKEIFIAKRDLLENNSNEIINLAKSKNVSIIILGDPMIATTHESLLIEAKKMGVKSEIVNGVSGICVAKSISGLQYYRFGKTLTIPGKWRKTKAYSILYGLYGNLCLDLHTFFLFDIDEEGKSLKISEGINYLLQLNNEISGFKELSELLGIIIHAGESNIVDVNTLHELANNDLKMEEPYSLAIPASLHFVEEEYLKYILNADSNKIIKHKQMLKEDFCDYATKIKGLL